MFGKKKEEIVITAEDRQYKKVHQELFNIKKTMRNVITDIECYENCALLLPNGADKEAQLKRMEEEKEHLRNCLAWYDDTRRQLMAIDKSKLVECVDWISFEKDSVEALASIYRDLKGLYHK